MDMAAAQISCEYCLLRTQWQAPTETESVCWQCWHPDSPRTKHCQNGFSMNSLKMYSRKSHDSCCQSIFHAGQVDIKCFIWVENRKFTKFQMKLLKVLYYQIADWKEVFMLFDRDEDGVLSFQELQVVMKSMGQRPSGWWDAWRASD